MSLPAYSLNQAARELDCLVEDLLYAIEHQHLDVCLAAPAYRFIIYDEKDGKRIGRGWGLYAGLVQVPKDCIQSVLKGLTVSIHHVEKLLEPESLASWIEEAAYQGEDYLQHMDLQDWKPFELSKLTKRSSLGCMADKIRSLREVSGEQINTYQLSEIELSKADIRILSKELKRFKNNQLPKILDGSIDHEGKSRNLINQLIARIIRAERTNSKSRVLDELKLDLERKVRKFDKDEILIDITDERITWETKRGTNSKIKLKSLPTRVSQIYKEIFKE